MWKKISVALENGKTLRIEAPDVSEKNIYVQYDAKSMERGGIIRGLIKAQYKMEQP